MAEPVSLSVCKLENEFNRTFCMFCPYTISDGAAQQIWVADVVGRKVAHASSAIIKDGDTERKPRLACLGLTKSWYLLGMDNNSRGKNVIIDNT